MVKIKMKKLLLILFLLLVGCSTLTITEQQSPLDTQGLGIILYNHQKVPQSEVYVMSESRCNKLGLILDTELDKYYSNDEWYKLRFKPYNVACNKGNTRCEYLYRCKKSPSKIKVEKVNTQTNQQTRGIEESKNKCLSLGFKQGTEGFGKCVLQLSK